MKKTDNTKCPECGFIFKTINEILNTSKEMLDEKQFNSFQEIMYLTRKKNTNGIFYCPSCFYGPMNINNYQQ